MLTWTRHELNLATCKALVARISRALGEHDRAATYLEEIAHTLRALADKPDTSALIGLVETLQQLAQVRTADACRFHRDAVERWRARGAGTAYLRRRDEEIAAAAAAAACI